MLEVAAAAVAWLGASVIVLSDGRRGLAVGTAAAALGLALASWPAAGRVGAAALAAGGLVAAGRRWTAGPEGWRVLPAGSTPGLVMCVAGAIVDLWLSAVVMSGPGAGLRFAVLAVLGLGAGRVLGTEDGVVAQSAFAATALAVAAGAGLAAAGPGPWPFIAGGAVAAVVAWMPRRMPRAA